MSRHARPSAVSLRRRTDTPAEAVPFGRDEGDAVTDFPFGSSAQGSARPDIHPQPPATAAGRAGIVVAALLVGFLISTGLSVGRQAAQQQDARKGDLLVLLEARQAHNQALSAQLDELRGRLSDAEAALTRDAPALSAQLQSLESQVGLRALHGPGLRVVLTDSEPGCSERPQDCRIQDADLQLAVNTLFATGAEGVAINGERVVVTTAIRSAGGSVLVNYRVLASPYVVEAVGNPEGLQRAFADSRLAADFAIWSDVYGLGLAMTAVDTRMGADALELPAYAGSTQLRAAGMVSS